MMVWLSLPPHVLRLSHQGVVPTITTEDDVHVDHHRVRLSHQRDADHHNGMPVGQSLFRTRMARLWILADFTGYREATNV